MDNFFEKFRSFVFTISVAASILVLAFSYAVHILVAD